MANFIYTRATRDIMLGDADFGGAGVDDFRILLVMQSSTAGDASERDMATIGDFGTLDIHDGGNYADKPLAAEAVTQVDASNLSKFVADDVTWTLLGAGATAILGAVLYLFVTSRDLSTPIAWIDTPTPPNSNGGDWVINWNSLGIIQGVSS